MSRDEPRDVRVRDTCLATRRGEREPKTIQLTPSSAFLLIWSVFI